jgi:chorismate mutase/prephenate dehydratase
MDEIETIYSKPEVFTQCRQWLSSTMPHVQTIPTASSAQAAKKAGVEPKTAAIGAAMASELYNIKVICQNIEDVSNNITRFFIIGREPTRPTSDDKTAIVFSTAHKAGALVDVLKEFQQNNVNLTNIESRPSKKRQREYYFFVDCQGHQQDQNIKAALSHAKKHCLQLSVLGSFPRAIDVL